MNNDNNNNNYSQLHVGSERERQYQLPSNQDHLKSPDKCTRNLRWANQIHKQNKWDLLDFLKAGLADV